MAYKNTTMGNFRQTNEGYEHAIRHSSDHLQVDEYDIFKSCSEEHDDFERFAHEANTMRWDKNAQRYIPTHDESTHS